MKKIFNACFVVILFCVSNLFSMGSSSSSSSSSSSPSSSFDEKLFELIKSLNFLKNYASEKEALFGRIIAYAQSSSAASSSDSFVFNCNGDNKDNLISSDWSFSSLFKNCLLHEHRLEGRVEALGFYAGQVIADCKKVFIELDDDISMLVNVKSGYSINGLGRLKSALEGYMSLFIHETIRPGNNFDYSYDREDFYGNIHPGPIRYLIKLLDCCAFLYKEHNLRSSKEILKYIEKRGIVDIELLKEIESSPSSSSSSSSSDEIVFKFGDNILKSDDGTFSSFFINCLKREKDSLGGCMRASGFVVVSKTINDCLVLLRGLDKDISRLLTIEIDSYFVKGLKSNLEGYMDLFEYRINRPNNTQEFHYDTIDNHGNRISGPVRYLLKLLKCCAFLYEDKKLNLRSREEILKYLEQRGINDIEL